jgi:glycine oxidase
LAPSNFPRKVEAVIIGGGIIGLAIGYYLSKRNFCDVEILEKEKQLTAHASGHNAGGISGIHTYQPPETWPLFRETQKLYEELAESSGFEFECVRGGTITPGTSENEKEFEQLAQRYADRRDGVFVNFLSKVELQTKEPNLSTDRFSCAMHYPLDAQGNSKKLGECFAKTCSQKGMKITVGSAVTSFDFSDHRVIRVKLDNGDTIVPGNVILAAGPWSGEVSAKLGMALPISPVKGHLISIDAGDFRLVNSFISGPRYYVMQNGSTVIVGGGEDSVGFDTRVDPLRIKDAWAEGISMVPKLGRLNEKTTSTACLRPHAADGIPILGKSKQWENVFLATGHFRSGFGLAPVTGKLISQLILDGTTEIDLSPFSPDRFIQSR